MTLLEDHESVQWVAEDAGGGAGRHEPGAGPGRGLGLLGASAHGGNLRADHPSLRGSRFAGTLGAVDDFHAPVPTDDELSRLAEALGVTTLRSERRLAGGLGCTMDVLAADGEPVVLRRYGPWHEQGSGVAKREAAALELATSGGVPVPEPIWVDDERLFEREAIVIGYVEGAPDLTPLDPAVWARQLAEVLAVVHSIRPADGLFPRADASVAVDELPERVAEHELGRPVWEARLRELDRIGPQPEVFLHTDFWPGNTLWRDGALVAVVDWEEPTVGDPMFDVAYCMTDMAYMGLDVGRAFVDAYVAATGRSTESLRYWRLVAVSRPMPDIAQWVPAWEAMGSGVTVDLARDRHRSAVEELLARPTGTLPGG
jgi:aminoglycoside phosphotransferase (APT) family kinase protein